MFHIRLNTYFVVFPASKILFKLMYTMERIENGIALLEIDIRAVLRLDSR